MFLKVFKTDFRYENDADSKRAITIYIKRLKVNKAKS